MSNWTHHKTTDELRQVRIGYPPHTAEHRAADEEIRRREADESKKAAESHGQIETQRHEEAMALSREEIAASHYSNRLAWIAIWVAVVALIVSILALAK